MSDPVVAEALHRPEHFEPGKVELRDAGFLVGDRPSTLWHTRPTGPVDPLSIYVDYEVYTPGQRCLLRVALRSTHRGHTVFSLDSEDLVHPTAGHYRTTVGPWEAALFRLTADVYELIVLAYLGLGAVSHAGMGRLSKLSGSCFLEVRQAPISSSLVYVPSAQWTYTQIGAA